jgi:carbamoyltransferase
MFVFPAAGDAGSAVGAALELAAALGERSPRPFSSVYLGPTFSDEHCEAALIRAGVSFHVPSDPATAAAELIAGGCVIGWFQGAAELGPRALGNRSILADPRSRAIADRVNAQVKHRASWRPFGPSVPAGAVEQVFGASLTSPHMLVATRVSAEKQRMLPGVVHVDGTTRPQTVAREDNPVYYKLLEKYCAATGVPAVLNTSFNDAGEPMVYSPDDAIRTFQSTELDYLFLGQFVVGPKRSTGVA